MAIITKPKMKKNVAKIAMTMRGIDSTKNGMLHPGKFMFTGFSSPILVSTFAFIWTTPVFTSLSSALVSTYPARLFLSTYRELTQ